MSEETKYVTWDVHNEFSHRIDDENKRQNVRLEALERGLQEVSKITVEVSRIATSVEQMVKELEKQGTRLDEIEKKPAKRWDVVITGAISAIVGAIIAALLSGVIQ